MNGEATPPGPAVARCRWDYGLDWYVSCGPHLWSGYRDDRIRHGNRLVCPAAAAALDPSPPAEERKP